MKREYPSTSKEAFEAAIQGAYFAKQMLQVRAKRQICHVPIEPSIPIHTFWDLGKDTTSIWFFQNVGFDYRFIDYFENSGEDMAYYLTVLKERNDGGRPYLYGEMYLPHDGNRKGMARNSPADQLFNNGYSVRIVDRTPEKALSIERARQVLLQAIGNSQDPRVVGILLDELAKASPARARQIASMIRRAGRNPAMTDRMLDAWNAAGDSEVKRYLREALLRLRYPVKWDAQAGTFKRVAQPAQPNVARPPRGVRPDAARRRPLPAPRKPKFPASPKPPFEKEPQP